MPYFLRGNCVVKGTKENPGDTVKCHDSHAKAVAHLRALYVHVEDAVLKGLSRPTTRLPLAKLSSVLNAFNICTKTVPARLADLVIILSRANGNNYSMHYRSIDFSQDRWIAISTREEWDREGEMFTKEAMDFDIGRAYRLNEFPEFRMYHVRGFKLGMCDKMTRDKDRAVDEGYWHKTRFARAVRDVTARNKGRWKISRGFYSLEATGHCRKCDKDLMVRPINYTFGIVCKDCSEYHPNASLSRLRHLKAITFDITLTDVPAVASTAVAAYSLSN